MDPAALRYLLIEDGRPTGPHSLPVLRQKAEIRVITGETWIAPENAPAQWTMIRDLAPLHDTLFPPKAKFALSLRPVEGVGPSASLPPPDVETILKENLARQRAAEGELLKPLPPRSHKRRTDYLILAGALNGLVALRLFQGVPLFDPFLVSLFAMGNIGLVWIMYFVMDRY